jgi:hypothetical protein
MPATTSIRLSNVTKVEMLRVVSEQSVETDGREQRGDETEER